MWHFIDDLNSGLDLIIIIKSAKGTFLFNWNTTLLHYFKLQAANFRELYIYLILGTLPLRASGITNVSLV